MIMCVFYSSLCKLLHNYCVDIFNLHYQYLQNYNDLVFRPGQDKDTKVP